jgi:TP901 family phage tail tape measure protein
VGVESGLGADTAARAYSLLASQIEISRIGIEGLNRLQENSVTLAQAAGMSLDQAADALAGTINQFGLGAEDAERVINVLAAGSKYGAAEITDLAGSFKVVGAAASAMGLNVEETAGALEVLSQANLKGSEAGTALRNIILKLNTTLGVDLGETSLGTALEALKPKLTDATYLAKVFGVENIAAAQFLIQNAEAVDQMTEKVTGTNTAQEQAAIRTDTTAQKMAELQARIDDVKIGMTEAAGSAAPYIAVLSEQADTIALVGEMGRGAISAFGSLNAKVVALTGSTIAQNVAQKAVALATNAWTAAQAALNAVMSANPIALVVLAIAALAAAAVYCYNHFEGFRQVCDKVFAVVKNLASAVWNVLVKAFEAVTGVIKKAWEWIKKFFGIKDKPDTSGIDKQTDSIEANTAAKQKNVDVSALMARMAGADAGDSSASSGSTSKQSGPTVPVADPQSYQELGDAIDYYEAQLRATQPTEYSTINALTAKIAAYKKAQQAIEEYWASCSDPAELNTLNAIDAAINRQRELRGTATASQIAGIDAEIARLGQLRQTIEDAAHVPVDISSITTYNQLNDELAYYESKLRSVGATQRTEVQGMINQLKRLKQEWDNALNADNAEEVADPLEAMKANARGSIGAINQLSASMNTLGGVVGEGAGAWMKYSANVLSAVAAALPAIAQLIGGNIAQAFAGAAAQSQTVPFPFNLISLAASMAAVTAAVASIPKFADGGIAYGPTLGLFGEYAGASNNPEVVAPLDRLRSLIGPTGGMGGEVTFRIEGRTLVGVLNKEAQKSQRI